MSAHTFRNYLIFMQVPMWHNRRSEPLFMTATLVTHIVNTFVTAQFMKRYGSLLVDARFTPYDFFNLVFPCPSLSRFLLGETRVERASLLSK